MAKIVIGKTPEQLEQERAELLRQREAEAQMANIEQEQKLRRLVAKQKGNRILVLSISIVLILVLLIFGTYNTFFKHQLNEDDVRYVVRNSVVVFPDTGLPGFIRDNFESWYNQNVYYESSSRKGSIEYVKPNLDSLSINEVKTVTSTLARVYFSVDIETKKVDYKDETGTMVKGETNTVRENFFIPIEWHYYLNEAGTAVEYANYVPVGRLNYYELRNYASGTPIENDLFAFDKEDLRSENETIAARIKVDDILDKLYSGKNVSQDYFGYEFVNTSKAKYNGIDEFYFYNTPNKLGSNAYVVYTITLPDGFTYSNSAWLLIVENGGTWVINGMI